MRKKIRGSSSGLYISFPFFPPPKRSRKEIAQKEQTSTLHAPAEDTLSSSSSTPHITFPSSPPPKRSRKEIAQKKQTSTLYTPAEDIPSSSSSPSSSPENLQKLPVRRPGSSALPSQSVPEDNHPASPVQSEEQAEENPSLSESAESGSEDSQSVEHSDPEGSGQGRLLKPIKSLAVFKQLNIEVSSNLRDLERFGVWPILQKVGWEKMLSWGGETYPSLAKGMYCSIKDYPDSPPHSILIEFQNEETALITPQLVSDILGIPLYKGGDISKVTLTIKEKDKDKVATKLCGRKVLWNKNIWLRSSNLLPQFKLIHLIFTYNVYPCFGNKSYLTDYMANILYCVAIRCKICLPTLMCSTMITYWKSNGQDAPPYCYLMSLLARHFGVDPPEDETPKITKPLNDFFIRQCLGETVSLSSSSAPASTSAAPASTSVSVEEGTDEEADSVVPPAVELETVDRRFVEEHFEASSRHHDERFAALEGRMDRLQQDHNELAAFVKKSIKGIFSSLHNISSSCKRNDADFPPSPPVDPA